MSVVSYDADIILIDKESTTLSILSKISGCATHYSSNKVYISLEYGVTGSYKSSSIEPKNSSEN